MTNVKKTLLTLLVERDDILSEICEREGEVDTFTEGLLTGNELELQVKMEAYRDVIEEFETRGEHYKGLLEAFQKRSRAFFGAAKRLKDNAKGLLVYNGIESISGLTCNFRIKRNKGSVVCDDTANYEALFKAGSPFVIATTVYSPNKDAIRAAIERGEAVDFARIEDGFSLDIKSVPDKQAKRLKGPLDDQK